ncbi:AAA domain-containing protein [Cellulosimicrobium protaetiae]|uniref:DUF4011 domain-containing protein n=1 Tax=Cellulosimicrobium protaetiae TaxID=2587808 RepID=A0A6M5UFU9_9MICO|nr:AAA domain-containing protein [Cellulosimicrobium protaetiae]QJW35489.1 DUF4011 domain-containing protein [Cellulosimicrobium protaetiae]
MTDVLDSDQPQSEAHLTDARVRLHTLVSEEWSWASSLAKIPQISEVTLTVSAPLSEARVEVALLDGDLRYGSVVVHDGPVRTPILHLGSVHVPLSATVMASIDERRTAECVVTVSVRGEVLAQKATPVDVQPRDLWNWEGDPRRTLSHLGAVQRRVRELAVLADGSAASVTRAETVRLASLLQVGARDGLSRALLATFVRPNHPEVAAVAREAVDVLGAKTGDPGFHAFQDPDPLRAARRADVTVDAVYETLRARRIAYSEPPPGWDYRSAGQRVRDHGDVARGGLGTCMDTTVLMAAVLEHVGVLPVLVLVPGHIFVGYWRRDPDQGAQDDWYPGKPVLSDAAEISSLVETGILGLIETTTFAVGKSVSARQASEIARTGPLADGRAAGAVTLIDVAAARRDGVRPLPAISTRADGVVEVLVERQGERPTVHHVPPTTDDGIPGLRQVDHHPVRFRTWKSSLFSLNARNALLNLGHGPTVQPLVLPSDALGELEDRLNQDVDFNLVHGSEVSDVDRAQEIRNALGLNAELLLRRLQDRSLYVQRISRAASSNGPVTRTKFVSELRSMARRAKEARDEKGMNPLFLCLGLIKWSHKAGAVAEAPLILVPVNLAERRSRGRFSLTLDPSSQTTPNAAVIEWLRREHDLAVPELAEPAADRAGIDVDAVLSAVGRSVAERGLPFAVAAEARLAILDLSAFRMWSDLHHHGDSYLEQPLIKHLTHTPAEPYIDPVIVGDGRVDPSALEELQTPIPADATQKLAVQWAKEGRTFVLQGPPGTGKSQTITNMVAECVQAGQKVLFVAEKGTALSVVQRRLDDIGMSPFTLNLHHEGSSSAVVRDHLKRSLSTRATPDPVAMESAQRRLKSSRYELGQYPTRLHRENPVGLSAYGAHDRLLVLGDGPVLDVPSEVVTHRPDLVDQVRDAFSRLPQLAATADVRRGHPWRLVGRAPAGAHDVTTTATATVRGILDGLAWSDTLTGPLRTALDAATTPGQLRLLVVAADPLLPHGHELDGLLQPSWPDSAHQSLGACERAVAERRAHLGGFHPDALALDLRQIWAAFESATASGPIGRAKRQTAVLEPLRAYLPGGAVVAPADARAALGALIAAQDTARWCVETLARTPGLAPGRWINVFVDGVLDGARRRFEELRSATEPLREDSPWGRTVRELAIAGVGHHLERLRAYADAWTSAFEVLGAMPADLEVWRAGASLATAARRDAPTWRGQIDHERLLPLQRWTELVGSLQPLVEAGMDTVRAQILDGSLPADEADEAFERGLARASQAERLRTEGLDRFDSEAHDRRVVAYSEAETEARRQWTTSGPAALLERRGGNGLGMRTGGLARELEKTRGRLGTRAILKRYGDAVQELTPLVLASPSSVVDLVAPGVMDFDLVIFDEASQITVPEAVGAIGRARAVVVVGDSKQMPPSRKVGTQPATDEEIEDPELEIIEDQESILSECELARVPVLRLSWHYRSQDEALIAFSNGAYYDGKLSSFPAPTLLSATTGVELVRVSGSFIRAGSSEKREFGTTEKIIAGRGTNADEALAVVEAVRELLSVANPPTIGIVTFNEQQRQLIEELLKDTSDPAITAACNESAMGPSNVLFVKALEQVQGDERDVVLFSVAFSKQANGKIPLNFGPLSNVGGERRLNVAVTRARRKNIVFCSFDPDELDADSATYKGVKDLKKFLLFARDANLRADVGAGLDRTAVRDRHRDDVAETLREAGLHVLTDVGLSDFRLDLVLARPDRPERLLLPVLLDGESWRSRRTVSDRDVLPVEVLQNLMRWPAVARIWWPMWLQNRQEVVDRILAQVDAVDLALATSEDIAEELELDIETASSALAPVRTAPEPETFTYGQVNNLFGAPPDLFDAPENLLVDFSAADTRASAPAQDIEWPGGAAGGANAGVSGSGLDLARPTSSNDKVSIFVPAHCEVVGSREVLDALPDRGAAAAVRAQVMDVITVEGPVAVDRLVRVVGRRFGLTTVRASRAADIARLVPRAQIRRGADAAFAWPQHIDPGTWTGYRIPDPDGTRRFDEIAPEEIANAMRAVVDAEPELDDEGVLRRTAAVFGLSRLGAGARARLEAVHDRNRAR